MKFFFKQMLKIEEQKSFIPKKKYEIKAMSELASISKQTNFVYCPNFQRRFCIERGKFFNRASTNQIATSIR